MAVPVFVPPLVTRTIARIMNLFLELVDKRV